MPTNLPVYIFKGDEIHLKKEAVDSFKKALLGKGSEAFNFNIYYAGKCGMEEVVGTLRSAPFVSGKRLVVLRDAAAASEDEKDMLVEYAKNPSKSSCLIIDIAKEDLESDFYGNIRRYAEEVSFTPLAGGRLAPWIQKEIKKRGKSMRSDAAALLAEIKQAEQDGLINEIEKLISYIGKRPAVLREDVEAVTGGSASQNIFELVDALSRKDAKEALIISGKLLKTKKAVPEILGMIGWQIRKIKRAKDRKVFTKKEIEKSLEYLLEADQEIKTGRIKPQDALETLIIRICAGSRKPI